MSDIEKGSKDQSAVYIEGKDGPIIEEVHVDPDVDAVFGVRKEGEVDYKSVGW